MPLTRSFKETVQARVRRDAAFRATLLTEGVEALLAGDLDTGKAGLRDYINATIGFDRPGEATGTPPKSLMRKANELSDSVPLEPKDNSLHVWHALVYLC